MLDEDNYFQCHCSSDEHTMRFMLDMKDACGPFLYAHFFINTYDNVFKRIWTGIKYIFGYKCKYGHWDEWIMEPKDAERLRNMLDQFIGTPSDYFSQAKRKERILEKPIIPPPAPPAPRRQDGLESQTS